MSSTARRTLLTFAMLVLAFAGGCARDTRDFDVRRFGARRRRDDARPPHASTAPSRACAAAGGGRVVVPAGGRYLTGTIRLRSNIALVLEDGSELLGTRDLDAYDYFTPPPNTPLVGDRLQWHRALILADGRRQHRDHRRGVINGNNIADPAGEESIRGPTPCCWATAPTSACATSRSATPETTPCSWSSHRHADRARLEHHPADTTAFTCAAGTNAPLPRRDRSPTAASTPATTASPAGTGATCASIAAS
jgi:hypothetical protein